MKMTIEPTAEFFHTEEGSVLRAWHGTTDSGVPVIAFVGAIAAPADADQSELERELNAVPGPNVSRVPLLRDH